jgi:predicted dehydrogenase
MPKQFVSSYLGYLQQYIHNLNLLRWFLDADTTNCRVRAVDLRDGYSGIVSLEINGVQAVLESGSSSFLGWEENTLVYGRDGWVRVDALALLHKDRSAEVEIYRGGKVQSYERPLGQTIWNWSYQREAEHFIQQVRADQPFRSSREDTLADVKLFEEIYRAYPQGQGLAWQTLEEVWPSPDAYYLVQEVSEPGVCGGATLEDFCQIEERGRGR